jgi:hypothetical protein
MSVIAAFVFAGVIVAVLNAGALVFWGMFLIAAWILTVLLNRLTDYRGVRVTRHDDKTITFAFSHPEYAREFEQLNGDHKNTRREIAVV